MECSQNLKGGHDDDQGGIGDDCGEILLGMKKRGFGMGKWNGEGELLSSRCLVWVWEKTTSEAPKEAHRALVCAALVFDGIASINRAKYDGRHFRVFYAT